MKRFLAVFMLTVFFVGKAQAVEPFDRVIVWGQGQVLTSSSLNGEFQNIINQLNSKFLNGGETFTIVAGDSILIQGRATVDTLFIRTVAHLNGDIEPLGDGLFNIGLSSARIDTFWSQDANIFKVALDTLVARGDSMRVQSPTNFTDSLKAANIRTWGTMKVEGAITALSGISVTGTITGDSLNAGSGDLIVAPTQNEVRIPNSKVSIGHSSAPANAIDLQWANGKNDTNYLVRLINSDVTSGEDKGVYIQAGSSGGAIEVLRVDGSASGRHFTVLGSGFTGVGTILPTQTFVINDSNARGGGKVGFEEDGTRYGAIGTGAWALGDGSTDITVLADAGHGFKVGTNGTVSFVITSGKNAGFGDIDPNGKVHVVGAGGAASGAAYATNPTLILEDGTSPILQFSSPSGSGDVQQILFGDSDSDASGILYDHSADVGRWYVKASGSRKEFTATGSIANGDSIAVNSIFEGSLGQLTVIGSGGVELGIFHLKGALNDVDEVVDSGTNMSVTKGTASSTNVYYGSTYYIENNSGSTQSYSLHYEGF